MWALYPSSPGYTIDTRVCPDQYTHCPLAYTTICHINRKASNSLIFLCNEIGMVFVFIVAG